MKCIQNLLWAGEIPEPNPPSMLVDEIQQLRQQVAALCSMQASRDNMSLLQPANHPPTLGRYQTCILILKSYVIELNFYQLVIVCR